MWHLLFFSFIVFSWLCLSLVVFLLFFLLFHCYFILVMVDGCCCSYGIWFLVSLGFLFTFIACHFSVFLCFLLFHCCCVLYGVSFYGFILSFGLCLSLVIFGLLSLLPCSSVLIVFDGCCCCPYGVCSYICLLSFFTFFLVVFLALLFLLWLMVVAVHVAIGCLVSLCFLLLSLVIVLLFFLLFLCCFILVVDGCCHSYGGFFVSLCFLFTLVSCHFSVVVIVSLLFHSCCG